MQDRSRSLPATGDLSLRTAIRTILVLSCWGIANVLSEHSGGEVYGFRMRSLVMVSDDVLLSAVRNAIERSKTALGHEAEMQALRDRYESLTRREREVMALVASGLLNKQVGGELGISEITVKAHRGQVMQKMKADSFAELVKMAARLGPAPAPKG